MSDVRNTLPFTRHTVFGENQILHSSIFNQTNTKHPKFTMCLSFRNVIKCTQVIDENTFLSLLLSYVRTFDYYHIRVSNGTIGAQSVFSFHIKHAQCKKLENARNILYVSCSSKRNLFLRIMYVKIFE